MEDYHKLWAPTLLVLQEFGGGYSNHHPKNSFNF